MSTKEAYVHALCVLNTFCIDPGHVLIWLYSSVATLSSCPSIQPSYIVFSLCIPQCGICSEEGHIQIIIQYFFIKSYNTLPEIVIILRLIVNEAKR